MTEHRTHIAGRFVQTEAGTMRQVFRACCSCGWRGQEFNTAPRVTRWTQATNDAGGHVLAMRLNQEERPDHGFFGNKTTRIYFDPVSKIRCIAEQTQGDPGIMFYVANDNGLQVVATDYDNGISSGIMFLKGSEDSALLPYSTIIPLEHKWALLSAIQAGMTWIDRIRSVRPYSVTAVVPAPAGSPENNPSTEEI